MNNQSIAHRVVKRRPVNYSSTVQNQLSPRKSILIFDDSWLEAMKHLSCPQWSKMSLVCRQITGIVQRSISRLPRQVFESAQMLAKNHFRFEPRLKRLSSIELLFNPTVYVKEVKMYDIDYKFVDDKGEDRLIRCQSFHLMTRNNAPYIYIRVCSIFQSPWNGWCEMCARIRFTFLNGSATGYIKLLINVPS